MKNKLNSAGFQSPNYTQTPNDFFDLINDMEETELRVTLVMIRHTFGFHRNGFKLGIKKLAAATGLSLNGARSGAERAQRRGTFMRVNQDAQGEAQWELIVGDATIEGEGMQPLNPPMQPLHDSTPVKESIKEKINGADRANLQDYPIDWQLSAGQPLQSMPDQIRVQIIDAANLIDTGCAGAGALASAFMTARGIIIPNTKIKAQRKAAREMLEMGVKSQHVTKAVEQLLAGGMTITDLYSVAKTAIAIANPAQPEQAAQVKKSYPKLINGRLVE